MDWVISVPVWGKWHSEAFANATLPAIKQAMEHASGSRFRFVIHTGVIDLRDIARLLDGLDGTFRRAEGENPFRMSAKANREAVELARPDEAVAFINADMVPSREVFSAAERRFDEGKSLIMMAATRTLDATPPLGSCSAELLKWTMQHRHPTIDECFWGTGQSPVPWAIYFEKDGNIILHGFHLHPFAILNDRSINFRGTIDADLVENYEHSEIHVVTDHDEASFAEMSPITRRFGTLDKPFNIDSVRRWAQLTTNETHRWFFEQPISIVGDCMKVDASGIVGAILMNEDAYAEV